MPVKDFILVVVYLLVPLACNFAKKTHLPVNCISCATHIHWMEIRLKEGRKKTESKYHDIKVKSLKWW